MTAAHARLVGLARELAGQPRLLPTTALLLRARTVRPSAAFIARERVRGRGTYAYRLRENGLRVAIRHGTGDVVTLGEVFHEHDYRPPAELGPRLKDIEKIVDLGANIGLFGAFAAGCWPRAQILAFEPDPDNAAVHARTIELNALHERWKLVQAAAGSHDGNAAFLAGNVALSRLAEAGDRHTIEVPVQDVLAQLAEADLVKMDIEGGEWAILGDPRFRGSPPRTLVLEYHPHLCPSGEPAAIAGSLLAEAGMTVKTMWQRADGHGMLWAWRS